MASSNYQRVLKDVERKTRKRLDKAVQNTAVDVLSQMIDLTPVKTGAAKYHWFIRAQPDENFDKERTDKTGSVVKARAKRDIKLFKAGQFIYLLNSAPYFEFLENGGSSQAPGGVVAITMVNVDRKWAKHFAAAFFSTGYFE